MQETNRSICEMACEVQASGLCVPDWVGEHAGEADLYARARTRAGDLDMAVGWERLCIEIEHSRRFLFDEIPNITTMGIWENSTAALMDYAKRIHEPGLTTKVQQLWS